MLQFYLYSFHSGWRFCFKQCDHMLTLKVVQCFFSKSCPKWNNSSSHFLVSAVFQNILKSHQFFQFLQKKLPKTFKYRPIWSHWTSKHNFAFFYAHAFRFYAYAVRHHVDAFQNSCAAACCFVVAVAETSNFKFSLKIERSWGRCTLLTVGSSNTTHKVVLKRKLKNWSFDYFC